MMFTAKAFAKAEGLTCLGDGEITHATFDSRQVRKGSMFIAVKGRNSDGILYVRSALENGAAAVLTSQENISAASEVIRYGAALILSRDPLSSLYSFVSKMKESIPGLITCAVTGSCGKTTTKEMLSSILSVRSECVSTPGNLNSEFGLPLSMLGLTESAGYAVFECGVDHVGEMDRMAETLTPEIAVVTNISNSHLESFKSRDVTAREKGKLVKASGCAFVPEECGYLDYFRTLCPEVHAVKNMFTDITELPLEGFRVTLGRERFTIPCIGRAKLTDASLAVAVARNLGFSDSEIAHGLSGMKSLFGRGRIVKEGSLSIIEDCYNANISSSIDAINTLSSIETDAGKHVIMADMRELGPESVSAHRALAGVLRSADVDDILLYGRDVETTYETLLSFGLRDKVFYTSDFDSLSREVGRRARGGDFFLLKGSRVMALERLYPAFREVC
ncbi:MAG: UDP-N-acetylmuramoyl-tripeptide--D-alanyl-D-alanine ligase [Bullifex sp.]